MINDERWKKEMEIEEEEMVIGIMMIGRITKWR